MHNIIFRNSALVLKYMNSKGKTNLDEIAQKNED